MKIVRICLQLMLFIILTGCATHSLWQWGSKRPNKLYKEVVASVLVPLDRKQIVVIGDQYHYIFEVPEDLVNVLDKPRAERERLEVQLGTFYVQEDSVVVGDVLIANAKGESTLSKAERTVFKARIQGLRYGARKENSKFPVTLSRKYLVRVSEREPDKLRTVKLLLSPVTLASDGAVIMGVTALFPIWLPFVYPDGVSFTGR